MKLKKIENVIDQDILITEVSKILEIFKSSECIVRPHFILTGPSGSGKLGDEQVKEISFQKKLKM